MIHVPQVPSIGELYETIFKRSSLPLPGLEDPANEAARKRATRIHHYLIGRADRMSEDCMLCLEKKARRSQTRFVYDTPWDDEPIAKLFCSDDCGDSYLYEEPWAYFMCGRCEREICEQHPMNGWHVQYRDYDGQMTCLRCYQELIIENGVECEKLEEGFIPGMFFSWGNLEPLKAGYREVDGFRKFYVSGQPSANAFRKKALELMDQGKKVVIGYESLGIGGGEGYVTLMEKEDGKRARKGAGKRVKECKSTESGSRSSGPGV